MSWNDAIGSMKILRDNPSPDLDHKNDGLMLPHQISPRLPSSISQDLSRGTKKRAHQCISREEVDEDDGTDDLSADKKRRLTVEQVKFLEMSFNMDLKLEPERKALIAKQLGIRPRQVAIWFQNRRARWKNKQLEHEYDTLKAKYETEMKEKENRMKEYEMAMEENKKLQAEVAHLKDLLQGAKTSGTMPNIQIIVDSNDGLVKEEELSGKSEVASPTKSFDGQSEMQDSGQSYATPLEPSLPNSSSFVELHANNMKLETTDYQLLSSTEDAFGSLVQHLVANGLDPEEAYRLFFNYDDDQFHGLPWSGC